MKLQSVRGTASAKSPKYVAIWPKFPGPIACKGLPKFVGSSELNLCAVINVVTLMHLSGN